jgi:LDH2 family malate/lactate/ureidoglycolate dehydrogenase
MALVAHLEIRSLKWMRARINNFTSINQFKDRIDDLIITIKASKTMSGYSGVLILGEPEFRSEERRLKKVYQFQTQLGSY